MRLTRLFGAALGTSFLFLAASSGAMAYDRWDRERDRDHSRYEHEQWRHEHWRHERPVVVREAGLVPARLGMAEQPEPLHQPGLQPRTSATWPLVSGEGPPPISRRSAAILAIASPSSRPWRTSQHPTAVPVLPTPPQQ